MLFYLFDELLLFELFPLALDFLVDDEVLPLFVLLFPLRLEVEEDPPEPERLPEFPLPNEPEFPRPDEPELPRPDDPLPRPEDPPWS